MVADEHIPEHARSAKTLTTQSVRSQFTCCASCIGIRRFRTLRDTIITRPHSTKCFIKCDQYIRIKKRFLCITHHILADSLDGLLYMVPEGINLGTIWR